MKNAIFAVTVALAGVAIAADPNPFANYDKAMATNNEQPKAVEWHNANAEAIEEATDASVLADFVADAESAAALLAQLKPAYETCPIVLTQIAAVTQWVMTPEPFWFWQASPAAGRKVWVAALEEKIKVSTDDYVKTFCQQQLDLCR